MCPWQTTERWKKWALQEYRVWQADVDHGTVAIVLVLNRLLLPLPLHQISDWVAQTVLVAVLGGEGEQVQRPALSEVEGMTGWGAHWMRPHLAAICFESIGVALRKTDVDLSVIFYDVTAFVAQGRYAESELIDFGFAHNPPSNKRKLKLGLDAIADGNVPGLFHSGQDAPATRRQSRRT